ncbi:MAG: glycosyltransferase [Desulfovermiculus sp.]|nr:glycosyltransferase [Desulfovermiculus sp.]
MFTNTYLPHVGGVARSVSVFARDLDRMGRKVAVVAPHFQGEEAQESPGVQVMRVPAIQNFNGSDFSVRLPIPFALSERIEAFNPDVIHSHHPFLLGDTAMRVARQRALPLVFTHHTMYEWYTHYVPFDSKGMKRFVINLSTQYANMCSAVVAPSQSIARILQERGISSEIQIIPTGIDLKLFASGQREAVRKKLGLGADTPIIGHVGRLAPEKNLGFLTRAVGMAMQDVPDAVFLLAGDGPSIQRIQEHFARQGLTDRFLWLGKQSGQNLANAYAAMDVFAFASRTETQGLVLAEAMAASTPVVALDASGTREVVTDQENGRLLVDKCTEQEFAQALTEILSSGHIHELFKAKALETAQAFSRDTSADKLSKLYQDLFSTRKRRPEHDPEDILSWDVLLRSLKTEWELISYKTQAVVDSVTPEKKRLPSGKKGRRGEETGRGGD